MSDSQGRIINSLKTLELDQNILAGENQDLTFAGVADGEYSIFAVGGSGDISHVSNGFLKSFLISGLMVIAVILLLGQLFTRKMAWRILQPLNALSDGAKRIENGDFSNR
ncbi:MAG: hypothetical protein ACOX2P_01425 [Bacillota bacterium]